MDLQSETPIYTQLVHQIIEGIASKRLKPGEPLPSVRNLASDLGINLHTVNKAYNLLKQDGYVQIHRQKGVMINPDPIGPADEVYLRHIHEQLRPIIAEAVCKQLSRELFYEECNKIFEEFYNN